ncbi:MAG: hypothetical protein ABGY10_09440 [bacterium]|jgi:hypothetical protein|nr:hypothetical protein [Gemmatimonadota bacterium]HIL88947.1 hypothetical protein [Gemmatimonadota bacterium]
MKKIVTASRLKSACKWVSYVSFVIGVSIFVNDAFIRDVTALDSGIFLVFMSVFVTMSTAQWIADAVDRIATISFAGVVITIGGFLLSGWLGWPTSIQNTAGILMVVFSAVFIVRAWKIDARG